MLLLSEYDIADFDIAYPNPITAQIAIIFPDGKNFLVDPFRLNAKNIGNETIQVASDNIAHSKGNTSSYLQQLW